MVKIETIPEWALVPGDEAAIAGLLARCFDTDFGGRSYFRTRHHLRLVSRDQQGAIIAHMALQFRAVRLGGRLIHIAALGDVATDPGQRGKGLAGALLQAAIAAARASRASHFLLFGTAKLYAAAGFLPASNPLTYLDLDGARTGPLRREPSEVLRVLSLGEAPWENGADLDVLGGLF